MKCDEDRPACARCRISGRACGGYRSAQPGSYSWTELLRIRPSTIPASATTCSGAESRSLDFFRCIIAPALTNPLGNAFWTRPVLQLAVQEPAARHAVLAISLLYEQFDPFAYAPLSNDYGPALRHYIKALREVSTSTRLNADTVLLISILFTCVEFLRGNAVGAIEHCRHGIHILGPAARAFPEAYPIFRHLSIFPFFFGATLSDFPFLQNLQYAGHHIADVPQALEALDCLMSSSVRLIRGFGPFRMRLVDSSEISGLLLTQDELCRDLDAWYMEFCILRENAGADEETRSVLRTLEIRWHVCKIWVSAASHRNETSFDAHNSQFRRMIELGRDDAAFRSLSGAGKPSVFKFEMGLSPLIHFVLLKCRVLRLRLEAMALLKTVACARESLWDAAFMYATGRRIIEREHGIEFSPELIERRECISPDDPLPSESQRIKDLLLEDETQLHVDCGGLRMTRRRIIFFVGHDTRDEIVTVRDWIYLPEKS